MRMQPVLVTGACGSLGQRVVAQLAARGRDTVALDLDTAATRSVAGRLSGGPVRCVFADLTDAAAVQAAVRAAAPAAVIHLAAIIPPLSYAQPQLSAAVNVTGTGNLVDAMQAEAPGARLVLASSLAVYGSRNGAKPLALLTADTPNAPVEVYGYQKVQAEARVRASSLEWVVLRIGAIIAPELVRKIDKHTLFMDGLLPRDNRIHSVYVDDVARAFVNAVDADCAGSSLLIAGDDSHRLRQHEFAAELMAVAGLGGAATVAGRNGDPDDDGAWFMTDWMDTGPAIAALDFRPLTMAESIRTCQAELGRWRVGLRPFGGAARRAATLTSPYRRHPGRYADPWGLIRARYGPGALAPGAMS